MGQHINPNIFRLGINKKWKTEFFEKNIYELSLYTFKDLEVKNYVENFLKAHNLILHDYKQHFNNSTLTLYISYFVLFKLVFDNKKNKSNKIILTTHKLNNSKFIKTYSLLMAKDVPKPWFKIQTPKKYYNLKNFLIFSLRSLNKKLKLTVSFNNLQKGLVDLKFINKFFKVLNLFTNNKFNITLKFSCLNKNLNFLKKTQTPPFVLLQKFKETFFLKEGIELLFYIMYNNNSADLLAKFIAIQIKKIKRHNFFLSFLKQTLVILSNSSFSKIKGIKVTIQGRLNSLPRAKRKTVSIGHIPSQSIDVVINHSQKTIHNSSGSYGIKVWLVEK